MIEFEPLLSNLMFVSLGSLSEALGDLAQKSATKGTFLHARWVILTWETPISHMRDPTIGSLFTRKVFLSHERFFSCFSCRVSSQEDVSHAHENVKSCVRF